MGVDSDMEGIDVLLLYIYQGVGAFLNLNGFVAFTTWLSWRLWTAEDGFDIESTGITTTTKYLAKEKWGMQQTVCLPIDTYG